jgi:hypothetical protein
MTHSAIAQESLTRAISGESTMNYQAIYTGFRALGIPEADIQPRLNVLTFWSWKALGRHVRKGEHGVKAVTFVEASKTDPDGKKSSFRMPRTVTVFHISQTDPDTPESGAPAVMVPAPVTVPAARPEIIAPPVTVPAPAPPVSQPPARPVYRSIPATSPAFEF